MKDLKKKNHKKKTNPNNPKTTTKKPPNFPTFLNKYSDSFPIRKPVLHPVNNCVHLMILLAYITDAITDE